MIFKKGLWHLFILVFTLILIGCGEDKLKSAGSSSSALQSGKSCGCAATYLPVCAGYGSTEITFDNECSAKCHGRTDYFQGSCNPTNRPVCVDNKYNMGESEAQAYIRINRNSRITQYGDCGSAHY